MYLLPVFLGYDEVSIDKEVGLLKNRSSFIIGVLRSKKIFHGQRNLNMEII
jgi:hypothetical protein